MKEGRICMCKCEDGADEKEGRKDALINITKRRMRMRVTGA